MSTFAGSIVGALVAGAVAAKKDNATPAVKDSYAAIRAYICNKYAGVDLNALERDRYLHDELITLEKELQAAGVDDDAALPWLAAGCLDALGSQAPDAVSSVGLGFEDIRSGINAQIHKIGTGVAPTKFSA